MNTKNLVTTIPNTFKQLFDSVRDSVPYKVEGLILDLTEQITSRLQFLQLSRNQFAERLNTSPAYVTKCLSGGTNFTMLSMVKMAEALDAEIHIEMLPKSSIQDWIGVMEKTSAISSTECAIQTQWRRYASQADETNRLIGFSCNNRRAEIDWLDEKQ